MIFALGLSLLAVSCLAGLRFRDPEGVQTGLIRDPDHRSGVRGLYMLRGPSQFIASAAERIVPLSYRYGRPFFDFKNLSLLAGASIGFGIGAIHIAWLLFDVTTYGEWSLFPADTSLIYKVSRTTVFLIALSFALYLLSDWHHVQTFMRKRYTTALAWEFLQHIVGLVLIVPTIVIYGNNGIEIVIALLPVLRKHPGFYLLALAGLHVYFVPDGLTSLLLCFYVLTLIAGLMAWLCLRITTELLATVWWYDTDNTPIVLAVVVSWMIAFAAVVAAPAITFFILNKAEPLLPQTYTRDWPAIIQMFAEGAPHMLYILALIVAAPLIAITGYFIVGTACAVGNGFPAIKGFLILLERIKGPINNAEYLALITGRRQAYFIGYALATFIALCLCGAALYGGSRVLWIWIQVP